MLKLAKLTAWIVLIYFHNHLVMNRFHNLAEKMEQAFSIAILLPFLGISFSQVRKLVLVVYLGRHEFMD